MHGCYHQHWGTLLDLTQQSKLIDIRDLLSLYPELNPVYEEYLLLNEYMEIHRRVYSPEDLVHWCTQNVDAALHRKYVRSSWVLEINSFVETVCIHLDSLPDSRKALVLSNSCSLSMSAVEQDLSANIALHPNPWKFIPSSWTGAPKSELRKAAIKLGWSPQVLAMQLQDDIKKSRHISSHVQYPGSVLALHDKWDERAAASLTLSAMDAAIVGALGKHIDAAACNKRSLNRAARLSKEKRQYLQGLVCAHIAVGTLDALIDKIVNNDIIFPKKELAPQLPCLDLSCI